MLTLQRNALFVGEICSYPIKLVLLIIDYMVSSNAVSNVCSLEEKRDSRLNRSQIRRDAVMFRCTQLYIFIISVL